MKKFLLFLFLLFMILMILPTMITLFFARTLPKKAASGAPEVRVLHADTGAVSTENLEAYLVGVVAAEMPASFHAEALRAQAVAARTYVLNRMRDDEKSPEHPEADVCTNSTHCKAWLSNSAMKETHGSEWYASYYEKIASAVRDTCGEVILYEEEPIVAVFHSTAGGRTENSEDVWGGRLPYLRSVESSGDSLSPKFSSTKTVDKESVCRTLGTKEAYVGAYTRSEGGSVLTVDIGGYLFKGTDIRTFFELASANFEIEETADAFIFHVKGNGHGVGLSQYGANAMAENGSSYAEILTTYYTGVEIQKAW